MFWIAHELIDYMESITVISKIKREFSVCGETLICILYTSAPFTCREILLIWDQNVKKSLIWGGFAIEVLPWQTQKI